MTQTICILKNYWVNGLIIQTLYLKIALRWFDAGYTGNTIKGIDRNIALLASLKLTSANVTWLAKKITLFVREGRSYMIA